MPEGDVVLRTARRLDAALSGQALVRGELRWADLGGVDLAGARVSGTSAVGKHLLTRLEDGRTLHTHLRMDGFWRVYRAGTERGADRSVKARVVLGTERWTCVGYLLGMVDLVRTRDEDRVVGHLGPDVLAPDLDVAAAGARIPAQGPRGIGEVLLDQRVVAGLGTIYLAETLWAHGVWPWTPAADVDGAALVATARRLMQRSVAASLPTATGDPRRGTHVHGREGRGCPRCRTPIVRSRVGVAPLDRPVFWCPRCQPAPSSSS
ncbi:Fpg/Nei family DNA glycosylase [Georgenia faecalis]|uniref:Fpg/Nei family DNA glycosylase n=1 Tax=Georgenia faecalis TaxID=2483799 RepID=UPI000FDBF7CD|nr:DNA-formamidopyrimidine glycosylase family protein [Georgenia faecalis]